VRAKQDLVDGALLRPI